MSWLPIPSERMKRARELRGWSVEELAERAGIARSTASRADNGRPVNAATKRRLANAFQRTPPDPALEALLEGRA